MAFWMVRSERNGVLYDSFKESEAVAIGWSLVGDLGLFMSIDELKERLKAEYDDYTQVSIGQTAGMLWRIKEIIKTGDSVVTYDPSRRVYLFGSISGVYSFNSQLITLEGAEETWPHTRAVSWKGEVSRDDLSLATRNSLGSLSTLFSLPDEAAAEFVSALEGTPMATRSIGALSTPSELAEEAEDLVEDVEGKSLEFIKDLVAKLSFDEMESLVAGILRALGYKTKRSPIGADRGQDILASPDALGLEDPRVIAEVKHRSGAIGAPEIRSFLGGRQAGDRGLYVSTGGFTKDARYEADRANIPVRLLTIDDLVELIIENYDQLDVETQRLVPLKRIYWPVQ